MTLRELPADILSIVADAEARLEGWCEREKSAALVDLVLSERPLVCVEVGVFGGRSLMPVAAALRHNGAGTIYGIDPWTNAAALEFSVNQENTAWWGSVDFTAIKTAFWSFAVQHDLCGYIRFIEAMSSQAVALIPDIDFLHIDGAHSVVNAAEDAVLYVKRLKRGGVVVMDDVNWGSTAPAVAIIRSLCDPVSELLASDGIVHGAVFRKR